MAGFSISTLDEESYTIKIHHICGHDQVFTKKKAFMSKGVARFGPTFASKQYNWLGSNLCPDCYNKKHPIV